MTRLPHFSKLVRMVARRTVALVAGALVLSVGLGATRAGGAVATSPWGCSGIRAGSRARPGQQSRVRLLIVGWGQGGTPAYFSSLLATMLGEPMLGLEHRAAGRRGDHARPRSRTAPGDAYLAAINQALCRLGKAGVRAPVRRDERLLEPVLRVQPERVAARRSPLDRGVSEGVRARLSDPARRLRRQRATGAARAAAVPGHASRRTRTCGSSGTRRATATPTCRGTPPRPTTPATAYVDVVGDDLYFIRGKASWDAAEALYDGASGQAVQRSRSGGCGTSTTRRSSPRWPRSALPPSRRRARATTRASRARSSTSPRSRAPAPRTGS